MKKVVVDDRSAPSGVKTAFVTSLLEEQLQTLKELARKRQKSASTVWRWALKGVGGVKLETIQIGGRRYTSVQAFERFCARRTANVSDVVQATRTNRQREAAMRKAEQELEGENV